MDSGDGFDTTMKSDRTKTPPPKVSQFQTLSGTSTLKNGPNTQQIKQGNTLSVSQIKQTDHPNRKSISTTLMSQKEKDSLNLMASLQQNNKKKYDDDSDDSDKL